MRQGPAQRPALDTLSPPPRCHAFDFLGRLNDGSGRRITFDLDDRPSFIEMARDDRRRLHVRASSPSPEKTRPPPQPSTSNCFRLGVVHRERSGLPVLRSRWQVRRLTVKSSPRRPHPRRRARSPPRRRGAGRRGSVPRAKPYDSAGSAPDAPWRQARQLHVVGGSAGRADDQHRRIRGASPSGPTLASDPLTNWKPCRPASTAALVL